MAVEARGSSLEPAGTIVVQDPARGEKLGEVPICQPDEVASLAARARAAQKAWARVSVKERGKILKRARREIVRRRGEIVRLLMGESGKSRADVLSELMSVCMTVGHLARRAPGYLRPRRVSTRPIPFKKARIHYLPWGIIGVVSPWNAPLSVSYGDALPALIAGNAVLLKPSEITPLAVQRVAEILNGYLPPDLLNVVHGEAATGAAVVDVADMIVVTGSTRTGKAVMERASRRLTPVVCELGGKDPMIVLRDADLERAANGAAWGGYYMTGQLCVSVERIYVEEPVAEEFTKRLVEKVKALRYGVNDPDADIDIGPFTFPRQMEIVEDQIRDAVEKGAKVVAGGKRVQNDAERPGYFFEPTVVTNVDPSMKIVQEETFGPVVTITPVKDAEEAIRLSNDSHLGLSSSVWTRNVNRGIEIARRLETGTTCVNNCVVTGGMYELPFGGVKESGVGYRNFGAEGIRAFTHAQAMLIDRSRRPSELIWFPSKPAQAKRLDLLISLLFRW